MRARTVFIILFIQRRPRGLFALKGHDLRSPLRAGVSDEDLAETLRSIWHRRTDRYSELRTAETASLPKVEMSYIGG